MNAIILAAGMGRRLYPLTKDVPKSLIMLGSGKTIFETEISALRKVKTIKDIYVVTGYKAEKIEEKIVNCKMERVYTLFNPFYDVTNNLVSAWITRYQMLKEDFILINGDDVFHSNIISSLIKCDDGIHMTIDRKEKYNEEDMKVVIENNRILYVGKNLSLRKSNGRSIGVIKISGKARIKYVETIDSLVRDKEYLQKFHLEVINKLIEDKCPIKYFECSSSDWAEVDFHPDIGEMNQKINLPFWSDCNT